MLVPGKLSSHPEQYRQRSRGKDYLGNSHQIHHHTCVTIEKYNLSLTTCIDYLTVFTSCTTYGKATSYICV